jgi:hypothetical protein
MAREANNIDKNPLDPKRTDPMRRKLPGSTPLRVSDQLIRANAETARPFAGLNESRRTDIGPIQVSRAENIQRISMRNRNAFPGCREFRRVNKLHAGRN